MEHLAVGMQIVEYIREHFHKELNEKLVLGLSDHISFAIERQKQGLSLANTLSFGAGSIGYHRRTAWGQAAGG